MGLGFASFGGPSVPIRSKVGKSASQCSSKYLRQSFGPGYGSIVVTPISNFFAANDLRDLVFVQKGTFRSIAPSLGTAVLSVIFFLKGQGPLVTMVPV